MTAPAMREARVGLLTAARLVAARELGAYFDSKIAYVYTIAFVVLANAAFMNGFFLAGRVDMGLFFDQMPLLLPFFMAAVTMRLWAEERKQRTIELLLTMPIHPMAAVLGKGAAAFGLYCLFLAGSAPVVVMLFALGSPDAGLLLGGYLGLLLLGAFLLALGMFLSSLVSDQIIAFVTTAVTALVLVLLGWPEVVAVLDGLFPGQALGTGLHDSLSVLPHYEAFTQGMIRLSAVVWLGGGTALFLWLTGVVLERNRQ